MALSLPDGRVRSPSTDRRGAALSKTGCLVSALFALAAAACDGEPLGVAGESCAARRDCASGLACIAGVCQRGTAGLSATGRDCVLVECTSAADCCDAFVPDPSCDFYEAACDANPADCATYRLLCVCNDTCVDRRCVSLGPTCTSDTECPAFSSPYCVSERCVECRVHSDCGGTERCVAGRCDDGCDADEECPLLYTCEAGTCVESGCGSDRECAFVLNDGRARCDDAVCTLSCSDDAECNVDRFEVCHEGQCVFVGCETDAECRAYLGLADDRSGARGVCE